MYGLFRLLIDYEISLSYLNCIILHCLEKYKVVERINIVDQRPFMFGYYTFVHT